MFSRPHVVEPGQSESSRQEMPSKMSSTLSPSTPVHTTSQLAFEPTMISALKSASTSAIVGYSCHVHDVW